MRHRLGKHDAKWETLAELKENGEYLGNTGSGCGKHSMDLRNMMQTWETLYRLKERKENLGNAAQAWKT